MPSTDIRIAYLTQRQEPETALSNLDPSPDDQGAAGAEMGIIDNNGTGRFLKQNFILDKVVVDENGSVDDAFAKLISGGNRFVVLDLPAADIARLAKRHDAADALLFNSRATDDSLRGADCSANLLHTMPSRGMLADALAQYLTVRRWTKWFLVVGTQPEDALYAAAVRRAAKRFGAKIVAEKAWSEDHDARRTAQAEIPVFTQGPTYDILIVADERGDFGDYMLYRTWDPRPVAGTQGLVPTLWARPHEQWGAVQLQNRFRDTYRRWMLPRDQGAFLAVRAIGEAATRTRSADAAKLRSYLLGPDMALAGYKGVPLSFRPWNGQLRQPILLADPRSIVSVSPQEGFLHPKSPLDTLGDDEPESQCRAGRT